jgi:uncharacterized membrane protein YhdT
MLRLLLGLGYIALTVYVIADVAQHPLPKPHGLPRWLWILAVIVLPFAGAIAWLVMKFVGGDDAGSSRRKPVAPDDDPEYLAWLERQRKRKERDKGSE